jgi:putative serine protease PepD
VPDLADVGGGILLEGTSPGSPASRAGLRKGDVLLMMAGDTVRTLRDMVTVLRLRQPGDTIDVVYRRSDSTKVVKVVLGARPGG